MTNEKFVHTGIRLTVVQREKLKTMAQQLGTSPNNLIGVMIDNARIEPVQRLEPVVRLREEQ